MTKLKLTVSPCTIFFIHSQITLEIKAQVKWFIEHVGNAPKYIDGHQHIHVLPLVRHRLLDVMKEFGISRSRVPFELKIDDCSWIDAGRLTFYKSVCEDARETSDEFKRHKIRYVLM